MKMIIPVLKGLELIGNGIIWLWEKVYAGGSFMKGKYSLVSAVGLILTAFTVPIVLLLRKLVEKIPAVEY